MIKSISFILCIIPSLLFSQLHIDTVLITCQTTFNKKYLNASKIDSTVIRNSPYLSSQEVLSNISNLNIQSRGILGGQSDISMRGGSYEQTAVFLHGIRVNNPQTGHNNSAIPLIFSDVHTIDVIKSDASKFLGANAVAGGISIETIKPTETAVKTNLALGSFHTSLIKSDFNLLKSNQWYRLSLSYLNTNGYRENTDNASYQLDGEAHYELGKNKKWELYGIVNLNNRKVGANGFYSNRFPRQYEELQSYFYNLGLKKKDVKLDLYWNQVNDYYLLKREVPSFYKNTHYTDVRGVLIHYSKRINNLLNLSSKAEYRNEHTNSSNLGQRTRNIVNIGVHDDINVTKKFAVNIGGNLNYIEGFTPFLTGGLNTSYKLHSSLSTYLSYNTSFRVPTFTELYYMSPTDSATSNLAPETARTIDFGLKYKVQNVSINGNIYHRYSDNQIDWVKTNATNSYFQSRNIGQVKTLGFEINTNFNLKEILSAKPIESFSLSYAFNNTSNDATFNSKYSFNFLKNQILTCLVLNYSPRITHSIHLRVEQRSNLNYTYAIMDSRIAYSMKNLNSSFYIHLNNITNTNYEYFSGIPMPKFNAMVGFQFKL